MLYYNDQQHIQTICNHKVGYNKFLWQEFRFGLFYIFYKLNDVIKSDIMPLMILINIKLQYNMIWNINTLLKNFQHNYII